MKNIENKLLEILLEENSKEDLIRKILDLNKSIKDDNIGPAGGIVFMTHEDGTCVECWTQDEPREMTWYEAREHVKKLIYDGYSDWSLPTKEELMEMYKNKDRIGHFVDDYYWSDVESNESYACIYDFNTGDPANGYKNGNRRMRAVRRFK